MGEINAICCRYGTWNDFAIVGKVKARIIQYDLCNLLFSQ